MAGRRVRSALEVASALTLLATLLGGCSRPLPDPESPGARAYAEQCGLCHVAYPPGALTAAMWEVQVNRMDQMRHGRGLPPLEGEQRRVILDYLRAHAG